MAWQKTNDLGDGTFGENGRMDEGGREIQPEVFGDGMKLQVSYHGFKTIGNERKK